MDNMNTSIYGSLPYRTNDTDNVVTFMNIGLIIFSVLATGTGVAVCWYELLRQMKA